MEYEQCVSCGQNVPVSGGMFCPECGKAVRKWCPRCGEWKAASYRALSVDHDAQIVDGEDLREALFCQQCGAELQTKGPPHE